MLIDEWLHRSMRKAQAWAVALAGRPLYARILSGVSFFSERWLLAL